MRVIMSTAYENAYIDKTAQIGKNVIIWHMFKKRH